MPHERAARTWGIPVAQEMERPYFHPHKINMWMQRLKADYKLARFSASQRYGSIKPNYDSTLPCLMDIDVKLENAVEDDRQYVWRIYEPVKNNEAYVLIADPAEGDEIPEDAGDSAAAIVIKKRDMPTDDQIRDGVAVWPQPVALIRSTLLCTQFAEMCLFASRYYNNATLAPESHRRGSWNALFYAETKDYPFWYYHETEKWSTRRRRSTPGFDTNAATRDILFKKVQDWEDSFGLDETPNFYDDMLLEEMASCIWNKKGKPDHATDKRLDLTVCWGIGLVILSDSPEQIRCNSKPVGDGEESWLDRITGKNEKHSEEFYEYERTRG